MMILFSTSSAPLCHLVLNLFGLEVPRPAIQSPESFK